MIVEKAFSIIYSILSKLKNKENAVLFVSFGGQYNDNPKYIFELLHSISHDTQIVWAMAEDVIDRPPAYTRQIVYKSMEYYKLIRDYKVVVDGYTGVSSLGFYRSFGKLRTWLAYNKSQLCISTWHGTPLKRIGKDTIKGKIQGYAASTSYFVSGSKYTKQCLESAYFMYGKGKMYGTPRNDILFKHNNVSMIKQKLKLPNNKIILYAPTFRDNIEWSGINQLKMLDIDMLVKTLSLKFGGEFSFVFRAHSRVMNLIKDSTNVISRLVCDGNIGNDMAEYLVCSDVLITDYSGSLFDIALTKKPCFLFAPDRDHYEHQERGFYMNYEDLPYPISTSFEQLLNCINSYSSEKQEKKRIAFLDDIGNVEDGHASERIVNDILDFLNN